MKLPKITLWKNKCGASIGKSIIHFTGILQFEPNSLCHSCHTGSLSFKKNKQSLICNHCRKSFPKKEGVYVTLKYPVYHCNSIIFIPNHSFSSLRKAVRSAKYIKNNPLN